MIYNTLKDISAQLGINEKKVSDLLTSKVIPNISTGSVRKYYYTSSYLLDYAYKIIEYNKQTKYESTKEAFLEKDLDASIYNIPTKCQVITVTNQKGGVGKTTSSANIAATLSFLGKRVLLVDMDSQAQSSRYFKKVSFAGISILNLFENYRKNNSISKEDVKTYIHSYNLEECNIDVLPSELKLAKMLELMRMNSMPHLILDQIIEKIKDDYDFIIIDTPPYSGLSLEMSIFASDKILLATEAEEFSIEGLEVTIEEINDFIRATGKKLDIDGIIVNSFVKTRTAHDEAYDRILNMLIDLDLEDNNLITNKESTIVSKSQSVQLPIIEYKLEPKQALMMCEEYFKYCTHLIMKDL
ncbi:ParA family protein [Poseidonibacter antarcticus]|uniref:ParA family protein n=1 Tax=Poseidonibacter antarcticus TaxID=2478538 RepID=UPI000EF51340|nr:ParA family protein [Poseidonibacter antarcticus]